MAAKPKPNLDTGAPGALAAIAEHELRCRKEMESAYALWQDAKAKRNEDDDVSMRKYNRAHRDYTDALEEWHASSKKLLEYDTKISPERREGEKISVSECKEIFAQYELSLRLAHEALIVKLCQDAALCNSPEQFHAAHAEAMRATRDGAIEAAKADGVIPNWLT